VVVVVEEEKEEDKETLSTRKSMTSQCRH